MEILLHSTFSGALLYHHISRFYCTFFFSSRHAQAILLRRAKMTRMYYFILHLSLADLLTAFFTLLPELVWTFTHPHFYGGDAVCRAVKFAQMIGPYLSSYVLIMTAIDRYQVSLLQRFSFTDF